MYGMASSGPNRSFKLFLVFVISVPLSAVTVSPAICPTNKIAPHRNKRGDWEYRPRTLGAFYDLLAPGGNQGSLQEEPQKDDPDDCGDIEDYDEHDLSSLTQQYANDGYRYGNGRRFFGLLNGVQNQQPPYRPQQPEYQNPYQPQYPKPQNPQTQYPQRPQYPQNPQNQYPQRPQYPQQPAYPQPPQYPEQPQYPRPTRPPYASGGYFENNPYRPPLQHSPSDDIKPVHDGVYEPQTTYRPNVVGGPINHVVGVKPVPIRPEHYPRPTYRPTEYTQAHTTQRPYNRYPQSQRETPYTTRRPRPDPRKFNGDTSIIGSFLDLLF